MYCHLNPYTFRRLNVLTPNNRNVTLINHRNPVLCVSLEDATDEPAQVRDHCRP
ncbi:hypothetical protein SAMN02745129_3815 [Ferrimonas marina]|uniref:Uncharacterized protein n=1 Tax=Ferrimonas marina TaxID=299255 RepID=A0A1M5Y050_9GAMM|nr:hypothetical protein SAMN02745129_3815 [Ferrimonas marina]